VAIFQEEYVFKPKNTLRILEKCYINEKLRDIAEDVSTGIISGLDDAYVIDIIHTLGLEAELLRKLVIGGEVDRYVLEATSNQCIIYITPDENLNNYPVTEKILLPYKDKLIRRQEASNGQIPWYSLNWPRRKKLFEREKILVRQTPDRIRAILDKEKWYCLKSIIIIQFNEIKESYLYFLSILNSNLMHYIYSDLVDEEIRVFQEVNPVQLFKLPIKAISFNTPHSERVIALTQLLNLYTREGNSNEFLIQVQQAVAAEQTDVVHDLLAHLAQRMIDLNRQKHAEVKHFLVWIEKRLRIQQKNDGLTGIDALTGKTVLQGYLGDYQKGEGELPWREFYYRLYQNRNRCAVSLSDVEGEIQPEYEKSLETLIPIKRDLTRTDALIDKIVYRLYGLTDEEIELIERPQYEQALTDAKAQVVENKEIKDDEEKIEKIAAGILPAARRFFERVEPKSVEEMLDSELPAWRSLPPEAPTFLLTGDYNLRTLPEHMDFSASVIPYTKAVEVILSQQIFIPFRQQYTDADCRNDFLKKFMRGEKELTLGNFMMILSSSQETALRNFISRTILDATTHVFGPYGLVTLLNNEAMRDIRNKAAHDEVLSRDEAQETRAWAMQILRQV
jgi:hypothetical protein